MASEAAEAPEPSVIQRLISSINGFTINPDPNPNPNDPDSDPDPRDRIILVNPLTQGMVVIEGSSSSLDSLLRDLLSKDGQPPASRASIEAMPGVEITEGECVICLEEYGGDEVAKEMPCKHRFHGGCIEKWLGIHGSCPVCRYKMPVDDDDDVNKKSGGGGGGSGGGRGRRREIWVSFSFNSERNRDTNSSEANESSSSTLPRPRDDHEVER